MELRQILVKKGHHFQSDHSDTETLLYGYREWGANLPERLNGMWAFAIYDKTKNQLFISRDRFGKKPLFYTFQNHTFVFASELSALVKHPAVNSSVSKRSLKKYFSYCFIPAPNTIYENIYKLPGGFNLLFHLNDSSIKLWKYWDFILEPFEIIPKNPEETWGEQLRDLLYKSVQRRLVSDVPLGIFLSGGIDSSAITAFASQIAGNERIKTFSIGFKESSYDESEYAKIIADKFKTDHRLRVLSIENAKTILPQIIRKLDEPLGDNSLLPTYLLCNETRKKVTVALGGDGGDELFAGYDPFHALKYTELYNKLIPKPLHEAVRTLINRLPVSHSKMSLDFRLKRTLRGLSYPKHLWNPVWIGAIEPKELEDCFQEPGDIEDVFSEAIEYWDNCHQNNIYDKTLQFFTKLYLQDDILVKADRASMMNSLEVRAPFLDIDLIDFVRKIPYSWKYRNGQTKYILKKALEPVLPHVTLYRAKKGFGVPVSKWFQNNEIKSKSNASLSFLNPDFVKKMYDDHINKINDNRMFLWNNLLLNESEILHRNMQ